MMRWLLALLLLVNLGLLLWIQMHPVPTRSLAPEIIRPPGVQDILLLRETNRLQPAAATAKPESDSVPVPGDSSLAETADDMLQEAQAQDPAAESISGGPETTAVILAQEAEPKAEPEAEPEAKPEAKPETKPEAKPEAKPQVSAEAELVCGRIGPYEDKVAAEEYRDDLQHPGISLDIVQTTEQVRNGYWVLIPVLPSTQEALQMVAKLKAAGVTDLWRFPKGPMKNIISLGWYLGITNATEVSEDINKKGFDSEVRPKMSERTRYWLNYRATDEQALTEGMGNLSAGLVNEKKACE